MQPKLMQKDAFHIVGLSGDGAKTGEVWNQFDRRYNENPFPKAVSAEGTDDNGYEIRFWGGANQKNSVHVGFLAENPAARGGFTTVKLPASEYAVFDVYVAKGYDSGNAEMEKWLNDHSAMFGLRQCGGFEYVVECYGGKFKNGDKPDSIVEIWLPVFRFCQSCYMPMTKLEEFGTEADGSQNINYCCHCYADGDFTIKQTLEEAVEGNIGFWRKDGDKNDDEARARIMDVFPKLMRWAPYAEGTK